MKKVIIAISILLSFNFFNCKLVEKETPPAVSDLEINISGLQPLPDSLEYNAWFVWESSDKKLQVKRITKFSADINGNFYYRTNYSSGYFQFAQELWITIEYKYSADTMPKAPSSSKILAGTLKSNLIDLSINHKNALFDFSTSKGVFVLATPTDTLTTNEKSGLWFVDSVSRPNGPKEGLDLPKLPVGWKYQGWITISGKTLAMGKFDDPKAKDTKDTTSNFGSTLSGFNFPGSDFLKNAPTGMTFPLDLSGAKVFITIQPEVYNVSVPFAIKTPTNFKVFEATIPNNAVVKTSYPLQNMMTNQPKGTVKFYVQI